MEELKGNESTTFFDRTKNHSTLSGAFECNYFDGGRVGSKTSQSSKVQMPGESLRERECLGFEVTNALRACEQHDLFFSGRVRRSQCEQSCQTV